MSGIEKSTGYSEWEGWKDNKRAEEKKAVDDYKEKCLKPVAKAANDAFFGGKGDAKKDAWQGVKRGVEAFANNSDCMRGPNLPPPGNYLKEKKNKAKNGG